MPPLPGFLSGPSNNEHSFVRLRMNTKTPTIGLAAFVWGYTRLLTTTTPASEIAKCAMFSYTETLRRSSVLPFCLQERFRLGDSGIDCGIRRSLHSSPLLPDSTARWEQACSVCTRVTPVVPGGTIRSSVSKALGCMFGHRNTHHAG